MADRDVRQLERELSKAKSSLEREPILDELGKRRLELRRRHHYRAELADNAPRPFVGDKTREQRPDMGPKDLRGYPGETRKSRVRKTADVGLCGGGHSRNQRVAGPDGPQGGLDHG